MRLFLSLYAGPLGRPFLNTDEADIAMLSRRIADAADVPYFQAQSELTLIDEESAGLFPTQLFSNLFLSDYRDTTLLQAEHEVRLDLLQIGLLVERHYLLHGAYPESLGAIAEAFGDGIPADPFTGESYRYESQGEAFLLYSAGRNQTDDRGDHDSSDGDIVWRGEKMRSIKVALR
jgi:hypothetical protein